MVSSSHDFFFPPGGQPENHLSLKGCNLGHAYNVPDYSPFFRKITGLEDEHCQKTSETPPSFGK